MLSWRARSTFQAHLSDVRLSKLKLAGFKTFVDPTTVLTPGNLVGVVGPNGCGKSNIIDAVRWVLGESRASALRGESMQDVIFNGSTTRKAVSRASVELVFDNHEGRASGQWSRYSEISVKRVLDRSGESSYFINNVHVRRRDVIDLFLGTGLGPRAYAIIEQGMISRIIEARPEEIRGFLEEAAGVTRYRERRKETEGRLADARDNLARLDDIRNELGERIEHLQAQADVASRYRDLSAAHTERQQLLWLLKRIEADTEREKHQDELNRLTSRMEADSARLQELEAAVEVAREAHFAASEATHRAQSALFAASAEVSRIEGELRHLDEARRRLEARLGDLATEHAHWQSRHESLASDLERWTELLDNARRRVEQAEARHAEVAGQLPAFEAARHEADAAVQAARRELSLTEQQLRVEEANRASAARALDVVEQRRLRLENDQGVMDGPDDAALASLQSRVAALETELAQGQTALAQAQAKVPNAQDALKAALDTERQLHRQLTELRARREALLQFQSRVQSRGKIGDWFGRHGVDGLSAVWQGIEVEPGWEAAIESVLRERLAGLTGDVSSVASAMLDDIPPDSLVVAFVDESDGESPVKDRAPAGLSLLLEKVTVRDSRLVPLLSEWLRGCVAADSIDTWLQRRGEIGAGVSLVCPKGTILTRNSLCHVAPDDRTHGVIERQREIDALDMHQRELEEQALVAHAALQTAETFASRLQDHITVVRRETQAVQQRVHDEQVQLLKLSQARQRYLERSEQVARDLTDLVHIESTEREHIARAEIEHARCIELAGLQRERLETALAVLNDRDAVLREGRTLEQTSARELQEARFSARECAGKLEDIQRNLELAAGQRERVDTETGARESELDATDNTRSAVALQEALSLRQQREGALAVCREEQEQSAARLKQTEELRLRTEHEAVPVRARVGELRLEVQAAELAAAQFAERLVEAAADETALLPLLASDLRESALQREVNRFARELAELGPVNLAALDELRSASARKNYLDVHNDDLVRAITTLEDAIRRIDRETREQLQETYDTVTRHFGTIFPQLFGGGQARLVLTGEEILDAGIQIDAQPPGKKNTSIHLLSGGEKALTAIALVFAMFQLNPAPFCMLDEVDAPLDDANTERYCQMLKRMAMQTQFVFISHSKVTMEIAQQLVGVTMQEQGVSRVVEVDIEAALRIAEPELA